MRGPPGPEAGCYARFVAAANKRLDTWQSIASVVRSWRLLSVSLLSFASGLPLGLVWIAIPTWMTQAGVDIKVVGLFTLAQAPWSFKFLWSPLMDRYPLPILGRKRGWILLAQVALLGLGLWLAGVPPSPETVWVIGAISLATGFAAATQDIAYDAYTVEVLRKEEQGAAVGARVALYRAAMFISGGLAITLIASWSWAAVNVLLALCYAPLLLVTVKAPEPESLPAPPKTLKEAVWGPFVGFLAQHRALEILAFVVLFKLSDQLTQALTGPFLVQMGFSPADVGVGRSGIAIAATLVGTFLGGILTNAVGLGRALWITGFLQIFSNLGYALVAQVGPNRLVMYSAVAFELATSGMGTGAFSVLLIRLTQKRFPRRSTRCCRACSRSRACWPAHPPAFSSTRWAGATSSSSRCSRAYPAWPCCGASCRGALASPSSRSRSPNAARRSRPPRSLGVPPWAASSASGRASSRLRRWRRCARIARRR